MSLNITTLFKKYNIRVAETVVERIMNGSKYRVIKKKSSNGRGLGNYLEALNGININEAIIEFLENYLIEGNLLEDTEKKIQSKIQYLSEEINNKTLLIEKENDSALESQKYGGDEMIYTSESRYIYRSNSYEINEIIDFVIIARMEKISPFMLLNELGLNYPAGTIHTWYKDFNELRILYSLYKMNNEEKIKKFSKYTKEQIIEFNEEIYILVMNLNNITEGLKNKYLKNIDDFNVILRELISEEEKQKIENKNTNIDVIKVITQTEEMWNAFANSNKEKIFEILYNDEEILNMILKKIYT